MTKYNVNEEGKKLIKEYEEFEGEQILSKEEFDNFMFQESIAMTYEELQEVDVESEALKEDGGIAHSATYSDKTFILVTTNEPYYKPVEWFIMNEESEFLFHKVLV